MTPLLQAAAVLQRPALRPNDRDTLADIAPEQRRQRSLLGGGSASADSQIADSEADDANWRVSATARLYREWQENASNARYRIAFERALGQLGPLEQIAMWQELAASGVYSDDPRVSEADSGCLPEEARQQILPRRPN